MAEVMVGAFEKASRIRLSAYDDYPGSELSEAIVVFIEDGIENLRYVIEERRASGNAPPKPTAEGRRPKS